MILYWFTWTKKKECSTGWFNNVYSKLLTQLSAFKRQPHKMVKHIQTIRQQIAKTLS